MASRLSLQTMLEQILGSRNVYFQPPASVQMKYPAIVYSLSAINNSFANDNVYMQTTAYEITLMDRNPDSEFVKKLSTLPRCRFDRHFRSDNLNHYVFTINY